MATTGEVWAICQVLHDWPDAECRVILSRCRERMRETDRLLVIEMLTVPGEPNPRFAVLDMMMLLYFGGRASAPSPSTANCFARRAWSTPV